MKMKWFAVSALALSLGAATGATAARAYAAPAGTPTPGFQDGRWDEPPSEYRDVQRQAFHDGVDAARRDFDEHRHKDAGDHEMYRHPQVERAMIHDYRDAFKHGYDQAMHHLHDEAHHIQ